LSIEIRRFFEQFSEGITCSKQAFCEQRAKLKPVFFQDMNQIPVSGFYRCYGEMAKRWKGMYLRAVDGSTIALPETEELRKVYGSAGNQHGEQVSVTARICALYDILNSLAIKCFLHPFSVSEEEVVPECLSGTELKDKVLLFDRGYPGHWLMYLLTEKGAKFVMRVQRNASNAVKDFLASDAGDTETEWYPSCKSLKRLRGTGKKIAKEEPVKIRPVKVVPDTGETEVLATDLYDREIYTKEDLKEVYHLRRGIETYYGYIKEELQLGQFSGIRQICVEQDFAASLFLYNLQSLIEKQTDEYVEFVNRRRKKQRKKQKEYRYKVNKNVARASLKDSLVPLFFHNNIREILMKLETLFGNYLEPVRPGRKYPRRKKQKPDSKHYTLTNYKRAA
jgi:hypothetical protein